MQRSKHFVTDSTFSITKAANPIKSICGTRVNDGTLRQVRSAKVNFFLIKLYLLILICLL